MTTASYWLIIVGMVAATFVSRYPMLYFAGRRTFPDRLAYVLRYVPPAVLISITVPSVLVRDGKPAIAITNEYLVASLVTALVAWRTKRMIVSLVCGMLALWGWRWLVFTLSA